MAAVLSYPGVYIEEVSSGVRPIATAGTSTPAFVGLAEMGPTDRAMRITNWTEFQKVFGSYIADGYLAHAVFQFFNNGGRQCYVVRVTRSDAATAAVTLQNRAETPIPGVQFLAKNVGAWGNYLYLQIENGTRNPGNEFKISVRRQPEIDVVPADFANLPTLESHDNLSMDPDAPNFVETMLNQHSFFLAADVLATNTSLQRGLHRGGFAPNLPLNANRNFQINLDYDGFRPIALPATVAAETDLAVVAAAITTVVRALVPLRSSTPPAAYSAFECTVETVTGAVRLLLRSGSNGAAGTENVHSSARIQNASVDNATVLLRLGANNGGRSEDGLAVRRPANAPAIQLGDNALVAPVTAVVLGTDGVAALTEIAYRNRFTLLDNLTDFSLLAVPGIGTSIMFDEGMAYCANRPLRDLFYIGEMTQDHDLAAEAEAFRNSLTTPNSYGAVYFPWIKTLDPTGRSSEPILAPPSGHIAGLYARIDATRGVWKAPAGTEATLNSAVGLAIDLTDTQHGNLNLINVNCLRRFSGAGIVAFGARTITADPEYGYIPVRRMAIMLRVSIYNGIQWAVFEPNDEDLWGQIRLNISSFMMNLFRQGAFQGTTPSAAFFVKCDGETTTQDDINNGVVNLLVGFAPLKPAEFVVVKISQKAGQTS